MREIKREDKASGDIRVVIKDGTDSYEFVACADTFSRGWDIFGFHCSEEDEDNLPGYREDGLTLPEVEEKIEAFIQEFGRG